MNEHTPGPWHVGTDGNVYSGETHGRLVAIVSHNANGVRAPSSKPANGRLIAAAPCLLTALSQIVAEALCGNVLDATVREALKVIAKAKGRG